MPRLFLTLISSFFLAHKPFSLISFTFWKNRNKTHLTTSKLYHSIKSSKWKCHHNHLRWIYTVTNFFSPLKLQSSRKWREYFICVSSMEPADNTHKKIKLKEMGVLISRRERIVCALLNYMQIATNYMLHNFFLPFSFLLDFCALFFAAAVS